MSAHRPRKLSIENLESRRVLATLTVNTADDLEFDVNGGGLTLREAIRAVNGDYLVQPDTPVSGEDAEQIDGVPGQPGVVDVIKFDPRVFGIPDADNTQRVDTIALQHGQLVISNPVTIDGTAATDVNGVMVSGPGWQHLTIDATASQQNNQPGSRIFSISVPANMDHASPTVTLSELSLTGGNPNGSGGTGTFGGAIEATLSDSSFGAAHVVLNKLRVHDNQAATGGGIAININTIASVETPTATVTDVIVENNTVEGDAGGGIYLANQGGEVTVDRALVRDNVVSNVGRI